MNKYLFLSGRQVFTMINLAKFFVITLILLFFEGQGYAVVITFDDLSHWTDLTPTNYAGLTWGTSTNSTPNGETGGWRVCNTSYSYFIPHSETNNVYNFWGADNLSFSFSSAVTFNGAWFTVMNYDDSSATQVRVRDDLGHVSDWINLSATPQFLTANFIGATTIWVDRQGGLGNPSNGPARWFMMDDVAYNEPISGQSPVPEPGTILLLGSGVLGLAGLRKNLKK